MASGAKDSLRDDVELRFVAADDPCMGQADELRHRALFAPWGLPRDDRFDDVGSGMHRLVALLDGRVVGYGCLIERDAEAQVRQMSVSPDLQRGGIGTAVMRGLIDRAAERGFPRVCLNSRATAETFYQRLGFRTVSEPFAAGRTGQPHVRMELELPGR